jgi:hypothetical protein
MVPHRATHREVSPGASRNVANGDAVHPPGAPSVTLRECNVRSTLTLARVPPGGGAVRGRRAGVPRSRRRHGGGAADRPPLRLPWHPALNVRVSASHAVGPALGRSRGASLRRRGVHRASSLGGATGVRSPRDGGPGSEGGCPVGVTLERASRARHRSTSAVGATGRTRATMTERRRHPTRGAGSRRERRPRSGGRHCADAAQADGAPIRGGSTAGGEHRAELSRCPSGGGRRTRGVLALAGGER